MRALFVGLTLVAMSLGTALGAVEPQPLTSGQVAGGPFGAAHPDGHDLEELLVQAILELRAGRLDDAYWRISGLVRARPDFTLAQLVYGDVLTALSDGLSGFGQSASPEELTEFRHEARARVSHYLETPRPGTVPDDLLRVPDSVDAVVLVDVNRYRLYLFEMRQGVPVPTLDFYASIGKGGIHKRFEGDEKTPIGVYVVDEFLPGEDLPDLYGSGAFPISYPNDWDRARGRTGSGIWIHGTESERFSRPPLSSRGCVSLSNDNFDLLRGKIRVGSTPVVVSDSVQWVSPDRLTRDRDAIVAAVEKWRSDWESRQVELLLDHYASDFRTADLDRESFAAAKRRFTSRKEFIEIHLSDLGIYRYPGERNLFVVEFRQRYRSNDYEESRRKRQFWRQDEDGGWSIVYEG